MFFTKKYYFSLRTLTSVQFPYAFYPSSASTHFFTAPTPVFFLQGAPVPRVQKHVAPLNSGSPALIFSFVGRKHVINIICRWNIHNTHIGDGNWAVGSPDENPINDKVSAF